MGYGSCRTQKRSKYQNQKTPDIMTLWAAWRSRAIPFSRDEIISGDVF
jgi:hypothetical protein